MPQTLQVNGPGLLPARIPARVVWLSAGSPAVTLCGMLLTPGVIAPYRELIWLLLLVPVFPLGYHRGWRGVGAALALGTATLVVAQLGAGLLERGVEDWPVQTSGVVAYLAISLGVGWLADRMHRDRDTAHRLAFTDPLTGLANRRYARLFLEKEFAAAQRGRALTIVLVDIDRFKQYNDRHGHAAGDRALVVLAEVLERVTRRMSLSARYGGEEFLTILPDSEVTGALVFVERVREQLRRSGLADGPITVSVGIATYVPDLDSPEQLVAEADEALYQAKKGGRDCVRVHERAYAPRSAEPRRR